MRKKKILLISVAQNYTKGHKGKTTPCAALGIIAAYTPSTYEVILANEQNHDDVFHDDVDLVGFSAMTCQIMRSMEVAKHYRARGIPTVIGGIHATVRPDDVRDHFDAIVIGEGDMVWKEVIADFEKGALKKTYKADALVDMALVPPFRHDLLYKNKTTLAHAIVQTSRGCPYKCDFCSVTDLFGSRYRTRPVDNVVKEIAGLKQKFIFFIDDNIMGNHTYAYELFERLVPLKKAWVGQASLELSVKDLQLLKLAQKSGCKGLFIGIESVSQVNTPGKLGSGNLKKISEKIKILRDHGLIVNTSVIFGSRIASRLVAFPTLRRIPVRRCSTASKRKGASFITTGQSTTTTTRRLSSRNSHRKSSLRAATGAHITSTRSAIYSSVCPRTSAISSSTRI